MLKTYDNKIITLNEQLISKNTLARIALGASLLNPSMSYSSNNISNKPSISADHYIPLKEQPIVMKRKILISDINPVYNDAAESIIKHEGFKYIIHDDSRNNDTWGIGFKVKEPLFIILSGSYYTTITSGKEFQDKRVADRIIGRMFRGYFNESIKLAKKFAGGSVGKQYYNYKGVKIKPIQFDQHPPKVQAVLIEMAYVLGQNRFMDFVKLRKAIMNKNYIKASEELIDSEWYKNPKLTDRVKELADKIKANK